jgi:hypothetical protein
MSEKENDKFENIPSEVEKAEEVLGEMEANPNLVEDFYQEEEEGTIEDFDSQLDQIGFDSETVAEKLTLRKIKEYNEIIEERERVEFLVEYEDKKELVYITVEKNFTKTNIVACIQEYLRKIDVLRAKKIDLQNGFLEMYFIFQIIKHFTDLEMPKSIENQLIVMERLINTGLLFRIFSEFPQEQVTKLLQEIGQVNEKFELALEEMKSQLADVDADGIENEFLREQLKADQEQLADESKE